MSASAPTPISHVNAWPVGDELLVTWRGGGDVSVFVSDDPVDAGTDVRSPDGPGRVTVERAGRPDVHLFDPVDGFRRVMTKGLWGFRTGLFHSHRHPHPCRLTPVRHCPRCDGLHRMA